MGQPTVVHAFPPSQPVPLPREAKRPYDILTDAVQHVCQSFPAFGSREQMRDNIDARLLLLEARERVLHATLGVLPAHDGNLIASLEGMVEQAEKAASK